MRFATKPAQRQKPWQLDVVAHMRSRPRGGRCAARRRARPRRHQHLDRLARAVARDCTTRLLPAGAAGVATTRLTAPAEGTIRARLQGGARAGDWDLAAFDSAGTMIAGSVGVPRQRARRRRPAQGRAHHAPGLPRRRRRRDGAARDHVHPCRLRRARAARADDARRGAVHGAVAARPARAARPRRHARHPRRARAGDALRRRATATRCCAPASASTSSTPTSPRSSAAWRALDRRRAAGGRPALPSGRQEYRTYEDVQAELKTVGRRSTPTSSAPSRSRPRPSRAATSRPSRSPRTSTPTTTGARCSSSTASTTRASGRRPR